MALEGGWFERREMLDVVVPCKQRVEKQVRVSTEKRPRLAELELCTSMHPDKSRP